MAPDVSPIRVLVVGTTMEQTALRLRDAGEEVIFLGDGLSAEQIEAIAIQEDVDRVITEDS